MTEYSKVQKKERISFYFVGFFLAIYLSNTLATGCAYLFFYLSQSLPLLGMKGALVMFILDLSRVTLLLGLFFLRRKSDTFSKYTMSQFLGLLSFLAFLGLSFSQGWGLTILFAALFGFSGLGPIVLSSLMIQNTHPQKRLRYYSIFTTSYSLSSLWAAFCVQWFISVAHIPTEPSGFTPETASFLGIVWPFSHLSTNPNAIFLLGLVFSALWILLGKVQKSLQWRLPVYGSPEDQKQTIPSWRAYGIFLVWALLLGVLWVSLMDLVPGYMTYLQISDGAFVFFLAFGISAVVGRLGLLPRLSRRWYGLAFGVGGILYCISLGSLWLLSFQKMLWLSCLSGASLGIAHGMLHTLVNVLFTERTPKHPGNATFAYMFLFNAGAFVSLSVTLWIGFLGYRGVFSVFLALLALIFWVSWRPLKRELSGVKISL